MAKIKIIIDGNKFSTLDEFFDEIERLLTKDLDFRTGHNFSAFHDLLRGGFGVFEYGEPIDFVWENSEKSRKDFGYEATAEYYEKMLGKCHPSNRERVQRKITAAKNHEGDTLFDLIVEQICDDEDVYEHTLDLK